MIRSDSEMVWGWPCTKNDCSQVEGSIHDVIVAEVVVSMNAAEAVSAYSEAEHIHAMLVLRCEYPEVEGSMIADHDILVWIESIPESLSLVGSGEELVGDLSMEFIAI